MSDKPKRAVEVTLRIGADDWASVRDDLDHLLYRLVAEGELRSSIKGGDSSGYILDVELHPEMTHDRYHAELDAYLADEKERAHLSEQAPHQEPEDQGRAGRQQSTE